MYFAKNILFLRKRKGLNQAEIPDYLDISRATWSNYENAQTEPDLETLISIAKFFGVKIDDLLLTPLGENVYLIDNSSDTSGEGKCIPNCIPNSIPNEGSKGVFPVDYTLENPTIKKIETDVWFIMQEVKSISQKLEQALNSKDSGSELK